MEQKHIIIMLVAIIVILAAAIGFAFLNPMHAKEPCKIKITSDKEQYEGGELSIKLTDLNKTPLIKQKVGIIITNKNGKVVANKSVITDSKGKAKCDLDLKKGKYTVNVTYGGNENYTGNNTTQKLTIKEEVVEAQVSSYEPKTYASGLTDAEIEANIQRDLDVRAKNGVKGHYDYEEARQFYENVPPEGMI